MEETKTLYEMLEGFFRERKFADLRMTVMDMEPFDIAEFVEDTLTEEKDKLLFFRLLPKELASDVFIEFDTDTQESMINAFTDKELKAVLGDMFLDDAVDIIDEMPASLVKRILKSADPEDRKQINELLEYPDDSAGSIMTPEFVSFSKDMTVKESFDKIRRTGVNSETIYTCYVTDNRKKLLGVVTVKDLLLADPGREDRDGDGQQRDLGGDPRGQGTVALELSDYDFLALPVVDKEGCIVGIVTVDDAIDVMQEEATEDIQKMAAMLPNEKPYLKQSVWSIWKARIPWLLLLMISATFTSMILSGYEESLAALASGAVLYSFVPMLMDTAGNAGGQSSVTVIRSLALGDVELKDVFRILWKELRAALLLGLTVSVVCFAKLMLIDRLYNDVTVKVALIVSSVLFITILLAKLIGCTLPLLAKKCRLDPAVVASPFITTIVDALSLIIYCSIAIALL